MRSTEADQMLNRRPLLLEMDDRLRKLQRTALATDDPRSRMEHAHNLLRAGRPTEEVDRAIGDDNPHRHELIQSARGVGAHDLADHLELSPLARRWQTAHQAEKQTADQSALDRADRADKARNALMHATYGTFDARSEPITNKSNLYKAARYFSRDLAPDAVGSPHGTGLMNHIAEFRGVAGEDGRRYFVVGHHQGNAHHWGANDVQQFKDDLDHHGLGKIGHHEVTDVRINSDPGDYATARPWDHDYYAVSAVHCLTVDPNATAHAKLTHGGASSQENTPRAYVSRDPRHVGWTAEQARRTAANR